MATLLSYALCTVDDVKENLGLASSDTSKDNLIKRKINQATLAIENYTGRHFKETTYTDEVYNASGTDTLLLKQRPVSSTASFSLGARDTALNENDWDTVDSELYFVDNSSGVVNQLFNSLGSYGRYRVTYTAGYAPNTVWPDGLPDDLREACASLAAYYVNGADISSFNVSEKREGQRSVKYGNGQMVTFSSILMQLGIDGIIDSYANNPLGAV